MKRLHRVLITVASAVIGLGGIAAALAFVNQPQEKAPTVDGAATTAMSPEILAKYDGINGNKCYIAVDGTVYLVEGSALWVEGRHEPSAGRASCGKDLSTVIDQAPHGRSKLQLLTVVGKLAE